MTIVIIEDERITAEDLTQTIRQVDPALEIVAKLKSVQEGIAYFMTNPAPDLIFSDIQLGDGLSFEILDTLQAPVIFCTAYDEYALKAFKANGIDYILKPFTISSVAAALAKFKQLTQPAQGRLAQQYESIKNLFLQSRPAAVPALLIHYKDTIFPVQLEQVALFYLAHDAVHLLTFDQKNYHPGKSLEELEELAGKDFFRVNRQYLVNRKAIVNVSSMFSRKLSLNVSVPVKESITISKEKAPHFLKWLAGQNAW